MQILLNVLAQVKGPALEDGALIPVQGSAADVAVEQPLGVAFAELWEKASFSQAPSDAVESPTNVLRPLPKIDELVDQSSGDPVITPVAIDDTSYLETAISETDVTALGEIGVPIKETRRAPLTDMARVADRVENPGQVVSAEMSLAVDGPIDSPRHEVAPAPAAPIVAKILRPAATALESRPGHVYAPAAHAFERPEGLVVSPTVGEEESSGESEDMRPSRNLRPDQVATATDMARSEKSIEPVAKLSAVPGEPSSPAKVMSEFAPNPVEAGVARVSSPVDVPESDGNIQVSVTDPMKPVKAPTDAIEMVKRAPLPVNKVDNETEAPLPQVPSLPKSDQPLRKASVQFGTILPSATVPGVGLPKPEQKPSGAAWDTAATMPTDTMPAVEGRLGSEGVRNMDGLARPEPSVRQTITQITQAIGRLMPDGSTEIRLSPEELGRVRMTISSSDIGTVVQLVVERSETLDLIRRHIDVFERDLKDEGFVDLSFSTGQEHSPDWDRKEQEDRAEDLPRTVLASVAVEARRTDAPISAGRLDLRM